MLSKLFAQVQIIPESFIHKRERERKKEAKTQKVNMRKFLKHHHPSQTVFSLASVMISNQKAKATDPILKKNE